jgi:hypothetical protein
VRKRPLPDVHAGQIWRDRDKRSFGGNRRVRVEIVTRDGDAVTVCYRQIDRFGSSDGVFSQKFRSRYDRFQRAFDLVHP